jgi:redox-sensing transcriptional repressor
VKDTAYCDLFDCGSCKFRKGGTCPGCVQGNSFLETWGRVPCCIYSCVRSRGIESCKSCPDEVCTLRKQAETVCPLRAGSEDKKHWAWRIAKHLESKGAPCHSRSSVPLKTLMRLRWYLAALYRFAERHTEVISSRQLADEVGINAAMVRKDFSYIGELGTPGRGYQVSYLQEQIRGVLDRQTCRVVWVGAHWLSDAQTMFASTLDLNFQIVAAFDTRPEWIGKKIGEWEVLPLSDLAACFAGGGVHGAVLALPEDALRVADALVEAGAKGILNLTPVTLTIPPDVKVRHVDLIGEMMALAGEVNQTAEEACPTLGSPAI